MMPLAQAPAAPHRGSGKSSCQAIDRRIRAFVSGESEGADVLGALYGHVADEPIPQRLRALLRR